MGTWWSLVGQAAWQGLIRLFANPVWYAGWLLVIWELARNVRRERRLFGVRVTRPWRAVRQRFLQAAVTGIIVSVLAAAAGVVVPARVAVAVTAVTVVLGLLRLRFAATLYSASVVALAATVASAFAAGLPAPWAGMARAVAACNPGTCLAVAAAASLAEFILLVWNRRHPGTPAMVWGRRGKGIGCAVSQLCFAVPWLAVAPGGLAWPGLLPPGWPWFGAASLAGAAGAAGTAGFGAMGVPLLVGHAGFWTTRQPGEGMRPVWVYDAVAVVCLAAAAWAVRHGWGAAGWLAPVLALASREAMLWWMARAEAVGDPLFVPVSSGVRVLGVQPGSLAAEVGIRPGEIITHINQVPVHTGYDLYFAFNQNPAYVRLQVVDLRGEPRWAGKPVYEGERHRLGLVLPPDDGVVQAFLRPPGRGGLWQTLYARFTARHPSAREHGQPAAAPPGAVGPHLQGSVAERG
ncbi:hypothetical protein GCM10010885_13800 [Alicyclobacillus cellulosilyticus]|uniref:PDZ domain-containing protein n=1 Tax=Alicyclobacillus cellulosilyticus TaxID=1003997 RepID=A0A917K975_9BACL|nr:PDZ domain-containing protein [Alicyclobacillus cellulosilyticus]GGJ05861.1 hypothetical protein GCM10010885_13800 [Alicyclobacillus cellulosilyticus]